MSDEDIKKEEIQEEETDQEANGDKPEVKTSKTAGKKSGPKTSKKVNQLEKKIKELETKSGSLEEDNILLKDQLLRKAAEFDNYKRRTEKEFINHLDC